MDIFDDLHQYENKIAIIDENENKYTYRELDNMIKRFKAALPNKKKSLVLIRCNNTIESLIGYLGGISGENTVLLVDDSIDHNLFENLIDSYQPDYIWGPIYGKRKGFFTYRTYELLKRDVHTNSLLLPELSLVMLTSGSTGSPKGVRLTRYNINSNAKSIAQYLALDDSERPITSLPMNYVYGLSVINSHLYVGATILLTSKSMVQKDFWDFFKKYNATSFSGVPYTYEMLKNLRFFNMELPSLRYFTQAGGKLRPDLAEEYSEYSKNKKLHFYIMYGQTEATARMAYLPPKFNLTKSNSIGIVIPGGKLYLKDNRGKNITIPKREGILYYEGPNVMLGYAFNREDLVKSDEQKGCLNTHDIAYFDEEGFFYIVGRDSRFIKIAGNRIDLDKVEQYLWQHGFECASGGYDNLLLIATTSSAYFKKIREMLMKTFKIDYDSLNIFQVEEISKNRSGKIEYKKIFSNYKQGETI
ncbi:AMP-binding protein [Priestia megaterium]|uniref:AMP-binding protein n=2 Tax=Priestia megaterium TaxID=1404 RepID=UPI000BFB1A8E|nr:AMP-binding protein [Priestia megaterium]PGR79776.1 AMP-dependent synthetase [Priestia megaterium]